MDLPDSTLNPERAFNLLLKESLTFYTQEMVCVITGKLDHGTRVRVAVKYVTISSLGIVQKPTEDDVCSVFSSDKKEKLRYGRMWLKRMINQAVRGSFECDVNAEKIITGLDHIAEVNEDIINKDDSVNLNLCALNEEMDLDNKFKEKLQVEGKKFSNGRYVNPKHFIELPNPDVDIVLEKNVIEVMSNLPIADERNIIVEPTKKEVMEYNKKPTLDVLLTFVDASDTSTTSYRDSETEASEDNDVF
jgi:hypothetical protein